MSSLKKMRAPFWPAAMLAAGILGIVLWRTSAVGAAAPVMLEPPSIDNPKAPGPAQTAVLAGGCFWGVQGVFEHVRGVRSVIAGYAGGDAATARPSHGRARPRRTERDGRSRGPAPGSGQHPGLQQLCLATGYLPFDCIAQPARSNGTLAQVV